MLSVSQTCFFKQIHVTVDSIRAQTIRHCVDFAIVISRVLNRCICRSGEEILSTQVCQQTIFHDNTVAVLCRIDRHDIRDIVRRYTGKEYGLCIRWGYYFNLNIRMFFLELRNNYVVV